MYNMSITDFQGVTSNVTYIIEKPTGFQGYVTMAEKFNPITGEGLGQDPVPEHFKPGKREITV